MNAPQPRESPAFRRGEEVNLKKLMLLETDVLAGMPLGGERTGFRKLVVGRHTYRIVYGVHESGKVVAMTREEAFEAWITWMSRPR